MDLTALNHEDPILKVLSAAQERIRDPKNWCRGVLHQTTPDGTEQWCARGAIHFMEHPCVDGLLNRAAREMHYMDEMGPAHAVVCLNNTAGHSTVMAMFDRARALRMAAMIEAAVA